MYASVCTHVYVWEVCVCTCVFICAHINIHIHIKLMFGTSKYFALVSPSYHLAITCQGKRVALVFYQPKTLLDGSVSCNPFYLALNP